METLNLSGTSRTDDNFFKRIFWPTIENQYDVDVANRRGFWLALLVGVFSALALLVTGHWILGLVVVCAYWLGANGIREGSLAAATLLLSMYLVNLGFRWVAMLSGAEPVGNPLTGIVGIALLVTCLRATLLSRRFAEVGDVEFPDRETQGAAAALADRMPPVVWPRTRIVFFVLIAVLLALTVLGEMASLVQHLHAAANAGHL